MTSKRDEFEAKFFAHWLPSFCNARDESIKPDGFAAGDLDTLSEVDAKWFLQAFDAGYVTETNGFFSSDLSKAKEQILWADSAVEGSRRIRLWLEPIITIGALARLIDEYLWPLSQVGLQSKAPWPFDLIGYDTDRDTELLACEVKKTSREIERLVLEMSRFSAIPSLDVEPGSSTVRNAYRKVVGIRKSWPDMFWALGPNGHEAVFEIVRGADTEIFSLLPITPEKLRFCPKD